MLEVDDQGWAVGPITPRPIDEAWSLLSPEAEGRVDAARWSHQGRTFFAARLVVVQEKRYPSGTLPLADAVEVDVTPLRAPGETSRVLVITMPLDRAPAARAAATAGVVAIGGAGMDVVVARGRRLWQVAARTEGADERAPLAVAAVLASVFLAPIVPPGGGTIFGVKGARLRLEAQGWRT